VLDRKLLQAATRIARQSKRNRSALVRDALREHIRRLEIRALEERDREGYSRHPQAPDEARVWEAQAAWPAE
jgi:metal-responsive CopG/Arc/MetJ family transcriptional regulator